MIDKEVERIAARLAARGLTRKEIAKTLDLSPQSVAMILKKDHNKQMVAAYQKEVGLSIERDINKALPESFQVLIDVMRNGDEKGATRLQAVKMLWDRGMGPVVARDDTEASTVRELFEALDKSGLKITTKQSQQQMIEEKKDSKEAVDIEAEVLSPSPEQTPEQDEYDKWLDDNLIIETENKES